MKHEFHFVLNQKLYFKLLKKSKCLNKDLSKTIVVAFEKLNTFIEKNHFISKEKGCKYKHLADKEEKLCHIHCYLPEHFYRKLKHIYNDLNVYSMAQILRKIIEFFLMGCSKYGDRCFLERLDEINKNWEMKKSIYRIEKRIFKRPMSQKIISFPYCITVYGADSRPYLFQLV
jgi:hypothetical protein